MFWHWTTTGKKWTLLLPIYTLYLKRNYVVFLQRNSTIIPLLQYYHHELKAACGLHRWPLTIFSSSIVRSIMLGYVVIDRVAEGKAYIYWENETFSSVVFLPPKYFKSLSEITQIATCLVAIILYFVLFILSLGSGSSWWLK